MSEITTNQVLASAAAGEDLTTDEMLAYRRNPQAIPEFVRAVKSGKDEFRQSSIGILIDLGRPIVPPQGYVAEHLGPLLTEPLVLDALVDLLTDPMPEVRNQVCVFLAGLAPGDTIQPRAAKVLDALARFPETDGALLLLGKTGTPQALELLRREPRLAASDLTDARMAQARLGVAEHEKYFLEAYERAVDVPAKAEFARRLGYIGTTRAVAALAHDIRSPIVYAWQRSARRSFRLHVIEGLHLAYLREPLFWRPMIQPDSDAFYEAIEAWLARQVGAKWETPRPPFLYEEVVPLPAQEHPRPTPASPRRP